MWDAIAYALGFLDCDTISARCMLTIFMLFAIRTEASVLRMLDGSPQTGLHDPIIKYLEDRDVKIYQWYQDQESQRYLQLRILHLLQTGQGQLQE